MNQDNLKKAARAYVESRYNPEDITNPEYKDNIDFDMETFEAGAEWASYNRRASFEDATESAREYARHCVADPDNEDDAFDDIAEVYEAGIEWYFVEVAKRWEMEYVTIDGKDGYTISETNKWYDFLNLSGKSIISGIISFLVIGLAVAVFAMASSYRQKNLEKKWQQRQQQHTSQLIINQSDHIA